MFAIRNHNSFLIIIKPVFRIPSDHRSVFTRTWSRWYHEPTQFRREKWALHYYVYRLVYVAHYIDISLASLQYIWCYLTANITNCSPKLPFRSIMNNAPMLNRKMLLVECRGWSVFGMKRVSPWLFFHHHHHPAASSRLRLLHWASCSPLVCVAFHQHRLLECSCKIRAELHGWWVFEADGFSVPWAGDMKEHYI